MLLAAVFAASLLSACGSSDSTTSTAASGETTSQGASESSGEEGGSKGGGGQAQQGGDGDSSGGSGKDSGGSGSADVATPLKVSGGGSEQFVTKGGDNSIQEFGEEGDESELQEAAEAVHGFFVARAEGDWSAACGYLSKSMLEQLQQLAESSTALADKGCASFLEAFTTHLPASTWREITTVDAGSIRHEDEQAFLIYFGADKTVYAMPLAQEDGAWKVTALSGNAIG
jgi:hypothetical protein